MVSSPLGSVSGSERALREACGVFGIVAPGVDVAKSAFYALYALQHRGQESAGIAVMGVGGIQAVKGMGLVTQVFTERDLAPLHGDLAIGHTRYSTTGTSNVLNAQPYVIHTGQGPLGLAHNGNLTNAPALRDYLLRRGVGLTSESDSELLTQLLAQPVPASVTGARDTWDERITQMMRLAQGAYSLVVLTAEAVWAVRDPHGFRPLYVGTLDNGHTGWVAASESCAFGTIGAKLDFEVEPGTIVRLDRHGPTVIRPRLPTRPQAFCSFEYVYFARPDSTLEGQLVHAVRQRLGRQLARETPVAADLVVGVPDSALPAALGFAAESGTPYGEGLIKNRYIGRTFIQPTQDLRRSGVSLKFNPLGENLVGKRVVLVDDSIVRGTTAGPIVQLLRDAGAREVHVRVSAPPVRHPCYMGVDMPRRDDLIAHHLSPPEIARRIGADSCAFLSHEGMLAVIEDGPARTRGHCSACFSGHYPIEVHDDASAAH
ncbi:MAG: amidophosphoribosyltransferase [Deltaproteobacteria bacterium]|nr:amidophosphoribosyltransferase [Deltaproteobacteria bacterium]